jgi:Glycosyl transferases group 1
MPEALACGTPVVAMRAGSVPEVLEHGVTGFICDTEDDMVAAIGRLGELDRAACRAAAEGRFSPQAMADRYERVYARLLGQRLGAVDGTVVPHLPKEPVISPPNSSRWHAYCFKHLDDTLQPAFDAEESVVVGLSDKLAGEAEEIVGKVSAARDQEAPGETHYQRGELKEEAD